MKHFAAILAALLLCGFAHGQDTQRLRLEKHLYTLASDSLRGREAGTADGKKAADYILAQWREMGLVPNLRPFHLPVKPQYEADAEDNFTNLVAVIEGTDPVLKDEYIVIGAHYDHIGVQGGKIHNGADDNASGSSCLIEIARQLLAKRDQLKRSVIICAYDAEEKGLFGSKAHVNELRQNNMLDRVKLMMSVDMVGWYKANGELVLEGTGTLRDRNELLSPDKLGVDLKVRFKPFENSLFTATDTEPYAKAGIPTLAVTTGLKSPYHKPEDDADLIDYEGLDRIADYLTAVTIAASRHDGKLASGSLSAKHHLKPFEIGLSVGFNGAYIAFPRAAFNSKSFAGFQGGLNMQYNFGKHVALRANVLYDYSHCPLPVASDAFGQGYCMEQHSLLVPVMLQLSVRESGMGFNVGFGAYYGRVLDGRFYDYVPGTIPAYSVDRNQYGLACNIGLRLGGHWQVDCTWYIQRHQFFKGSDFPEANLNIFSCSLGYYF